MKDKPVFLIRVDGGVHVGMGHLCKTTILAAKLKSAFKGSKIQFLIKRDETGAAWLKKTGAPVVRIPASREREKEPEWILSRFGKIKNLILILDILAVSSRYLSLFKKQGIKVVTFENKGQSRYGAHATFNTLVQGLEQKTETVNGSKVFRGPKFRILHPDYLDYRKKAVKFSKKKSILITLGGGTDKGFSEILIDEILKACSEIPLEINLVVGPAQARPELNGSESRVQVLGPQPNLAKVFYKADAVITAGGGTLYELACLGVPAIAFHKVGHQRGNIAMFQKAGTVLSAGSMNRRNAKACASRLKRLLQDKKECQKISNAGKTLVDGQGLERITKIFDLLLKGATYSL